MNTVIRSMRVKFLLLTPICIFLGVSTVIAGNTNIDILLLGLALGAAILAHISVNTLNEYLDFKSGLDLITTRTAFSGGSGALPAEPDKAGTILAVGIVCLLATSAIGIYFVLLHGIDIIVLGLVGLALILSYSGWINRHPLLCLLAPGTGFGFLMVVGTQFVLTGHYSMQAWLVAGVPFFLVNNLLLLNQYPDIPADAEVGRRHFAIVYGIKKSNIAYALFVVMTIAIIILTIAGGYLSEFGFIAVLPMPLAFYALYGASKHGQRIGEHQQYLGANVAATLLTPLLLAIAITLD